MWRGYVLRALKGWMLSMDGDRSGIDADRLVSQSVRVRSGRVRSSQVKSGWVRSSQVRSGQIGRGADDGEKKKIRKKEEERSRRKRRGLLYPSPESLQAGWHGPPASSSGM